MRMLSERAVEMQKDVYLCFIDYEKAFDTVRHADMLEMLRRIGADSRDIRVIRNLYYEQKAAVRVENELTDKVDIKRGVRQGCVLSPDLFSLYAEVILSDLVALPGFQIGGRNPNNIRYADDAVLIADSEQKLQDLVDAANTASEEKGLKINKSKTECVTITMGSEPVACAIHVNQHQIKQVDEFEYLGSILTKDARCKREIVRRIGIAKTEFRRMTRIVTNRHLRIATRVRVIKTYIWSTVLYGCESRTLTQETRKRLKAMEMWCWRRMLKISWTERKTNESILDDIGRRRELLAVIRRRLMRFLGHVVRREDLENLILTGRIEGRRGRGRPRIKYMDDTKSAIGGGLTTQQIMYAARDREQWRSMISNVFSDMAHR